MRWHVIPAAISALAFALPAGAAGFTPPKGGEAFLTVQNKGCSVSVQWRCGAAPYSDFWSATFSRDGLQSVVSYSGDYQWLDAIYLWDNSREEFSRPAADPVSLDALLEDGVDTYDFTRFSWTPDIEVVLIDAQDEPPQGGGEPAIICMGGLIANAIFDACGARLYQMPMTPDRVLEAMA